MSNEYNIAVDCVDKHPADLPVLVCVDWDSVSQKCRSRLFSFGELQSLTNRFARGLKALGLARGDRILLPLPNGFEFPVAFIGAIKAGLIPIPASPLLTKSEINFLVKDSGGSLLVTKELDLWARLESFSPDHFPIVKSAGDDPAYWLYTSGTEGVPKAVIHAHRSIPAHDSRVKLWLDLKPGDVVFNTSSLNWSYALTCGLLDVWRHGNQTVIFNGPLRPELLCGVIAEQKVTVFMSVPGVYRRLVESHRAKSFNKVRVCLSAGEKLPEEIRERFREATGITIREGLGMTEHSVYLVQSVGDPVVAGSCGKPLPGTRIAILRDDLTECASGETGVIASHRSCQGLMLGYHGSPSPQPSPIKGEGAQRYAPPCKGGEIVPEIPSPLVGEGKGEGGEWFVSDDLAYRDEAGNFFFVGRRDDVIAAGGYRISPMEVESVLNQHPAIEESAVVGREIEAAKTIVCAFVVCRKEIKKPTKEEVTFHAASKLAKYKVPREIVFTDSLPKTESGKIRRRELSEPRDEASET